MAEVAKAFVSILPSMRGFTPALTKEMSGPADAAGKQAGDKAGAGFKGSFLAGLKGIAAPLAGIFAGTQVLGFFKDSIGAASDLEQSVGGVQAIFKDAAGDVAAFAAGAAENLGLSENSYNSLAAIIGTTLKASGTSMDELAGATDSMIGRAADLSATFGGTVVEASNAMASALRGEFEPLRQYGVMLSAADINARALADSGKANVAELTAQEKALATQALIFEQSADSAGRFGDESDTLAGKQERLRARFDNLKTTIGGALLPVMSTFVGFLGGSLLPGIEGLGGKVQAFAGWLDTWKVPLGVVAGVITAVFLPALIQLGVQQTIAAARAVAAWAVQTAASVAGAAAQSLAVVRVVAGWALMATQSLLQAARMAAAWFIAMGPVGWVIGAVVALAALIIANWDRIVAWTKQAWSSVTAWLAGAWENIKAAAANVWNALLGFFRSIGQRIVQFFLNWTLPGLLIKHWSSIKEGAVRGFTAVVDFVRGVPGRIVTGLGNLGRLLVAPGRQLLEGLIAGIREKVAGAVEAVRDAVGSVISGAKNLLGISSPSKVFAGFGEDIGEGLRLGIRSSQDDVRDAVGALVSPASLRANLDLMASTGAAADGRPVELGTRTIKAISQGILEGAQTVSVGVVSDHSRAVRLAGVR